MFDGFKENNNILNKNEKLIKQYPFLRIDKACWWNPISEKYNIGYTWLDELEPGWKAAFGECLCKELKKSIEEDGCADEFHFLQIKEKFGYLRLYASGYGDKTKEILAKYEELSKYICGHCGKTATKVTTGWIYPFCDECVKKIHDKSVDIWEFYGYNSIEEIEEEIQNIQTNFKYNEYWTEVRKEVDEESNA